MSAPRPAPPAGCASWLDYVLTPEVSVWTSHLSPKDCARAELAELRKELKDLEEYHQETVWEKNDFEDQRDAARKELADTKRIKEVACRDLETWQVSYDAAHKALEQAKAQLALQAANTVEAMQQRDAAQAERDEARAQVAELKKGILALGGLPGIPRDGGIGGRRRFEMSMQYEKYWDWNRFVGLVRGEQKGPDCDACEGKGYFYVNKRPYFCEVCSGWSWLGPENDSGREERRAKQAAFVAKLRDEALPGAGEPAAGEVQP